MSLNELLYQLSYVGLEVGAGLPQQLSARHRNRRR